MRHQTSFPQSERKIVAKWIPERAIGFPVGYAVSGILLTVFGHFAMILAQ
jgi:hypothetical protein